MLRTIRVLWIAVGTLLVLGFIRLYGFLHETQYYWTFHNLATMSLKDVSIIGFAITLAIPFLAGIILVKVAKKPIVTEATIAGFLATLLQSWPILFFTNLRPQLIPYWLKNQPFKLFVLQVLYIVSYTTLCRLGALLASRSYPKSIEKKHSDDSVLRAILVGVIVCIIWQVLSSMWR